MPKLTEALIAGRLPPCRAPATPPPRLDDGALRATMAGALAGRREGERLRLFSYGALMWMREEVPGAEARPAVLPGFARAWCLRDIHNRGTPEAPGLTLGIRPRPDARCEGVLFELPEDPGAEREALSSAWRQEMGPGFYRPAWVDVMPLPQGPPARAIAFVADEAHPLFAGAPAEEEQARVLAGSVGPQGPAAAYLMQALAALRAEGLGDRLLERLDGMVAERLGAPAGR